MFEYNDHRRQFDLAEQVDQILPEIAVAPKVLPIAQPESRGFELPARIWLAMIACYGLFLAAMFVALGGSGKAMLSIAVSVIYVSVFFSVGRIVVRQNPGRGASPLDRDGFLMTHFGPMERKAVYGQILVVPAAVSFFGVAVAVIIGFSGVAA